MKLIIDTETKTLVRDAGEQTSSLPLYSPESFELLSQLWLKVSWSQKYSYAFSWLGRPIIQLPEDMVRAQEVIYALKPDVIIETGIAHGGSLIYYASLCALMGKGRVAGIDIEIRPHNRRAIESHRLSSLITLIEGSATDPAVISTVKDLIRPGERVLVILDSNHSKAHVLAELNAYSQFVTPGSYIIATDGIMKDMLDVPGGNPSWEHDNPATAAIEFAGAHPEFVVEQPAWLFNESSLTKSITHWPGAWVRRIV